MDIYLSLFFTWLILIYAAIEDVRHMHVSDLCFAAISLASCEMHIRDFLITALLYLIIIVIASIIKLHVPLGMADAKILAAISFSFGIRFCSRCFIISALGAGFFACVIVLKSRLLKKAPPKAIPYVPFIFMGFTAQSLASLL